MNGNSIGADLGNGQAEEVAREAGNPQAASAAPVSRESRNQSDRSDHRTERIYIIRTNRTRSLEELLRFYQFDFETQEMPP